MKRVVFPENVSIQQHLHVVDIWHSYYTNTVYSDPDSNCVPTPGRSSLLLDLDLSLKRNALHGRKSSRSGIIPIVFLPILTSSAAIVLNEHPQKVNAIAVHKP